MPFLFIFPGQGSQYAGIGSDLYREHAPVREIYTLASDVLGYDMARLSFEDPDGVIDLTRNTQPALLTHQLACLAALESRTGGRLRPDVSGGHSLGEYAALVVAGVLTPETALSLVARRGELMGRHGEGEMEALPLERDDAARLADKHMCAVAACNLSGQTVVGGRSLDLDRLVADLAAEQPRKRTTRLKTEGAFHTYYMVGAALAFREALDEAPFSAPGIQVLSNYTGGFHEPDVDTIKARLFFQLFHPVLWHANLTIAGEAGVDTIIEFGGGLGGDRDPASKRPNLESMVKRTFRGREPSPAYHPVINLQTLDGTAQALAG